MAKDQWDKMMDEGPAEKRRASGDSPGDPPESKTRDNFTHHSSPTPGDVQEQPPQLQMPKIGQRGQREITGSKPRAVDMPEPVTKHPEPRGRPRASEASESQDNYED